MFYHSTPKGDARIPGIQYKYGLGVLKYGYVKDHKFDYSLRLFALGTICQHF